MHKLYLGLGSNIERERYLIAGLDALEAMFSRMRLSSVYDSEAIGYDGQAFLNMVVQVTSDMPLAEIIQQLRRIEVEHGRPPNARRDTPRQLDIDILTCDDLVGTHHGVELPRYEIVENAFVLCPLAELAPDDRHPVNGQSYARLWSDYDRAAQQLERIDFSWRDRSISSVGPLPG